MYQVDLCVHTMYPVHGTVAHGVHIRMLTVLSLTMYEFTVYHSQWFAHTDTRSK